ncbi:hypothetical protein ACHQM5_024870 [Ranunculus cassubicifolius]
MDDERVNTDKSPLIDRIQHLERERDELRKDIEQLCFQQSGPTYLAVATRMHFQRTASLEQEIESLKKKLAVSARNNLNLQEELSEVYHIKSQLADLHSVEVSKNMEAEKQLKFFQGCVASSFAERDNALMEAEKAKETEGLMLQEVNTLRRRIEEMTSNFLEDKKSLTSLHIELSKLKEQNENFQKVITKFYDIRQSFSKVDEDPCLDDKCEYLLQDTPETWSFNSNTENHASEYITALEKELETLRTSVDRHQNKMRMGLEIENHLKKRVHELEKEKIDFDDMIKSKISKLQHCQTQHRSEVIDILQHEKAQFKTMLDVLPEMIKRFHMNPTRDFDHSEGDAETVDIECRDVHINTDLDVNLASEEKTTSSPIAIHEGNAGTSEALVQALQEKVSALLLLSQQEERHLLERNVNATLFKKLEELQRNLLQVTNEKVKALMELAQLRQDYQLLQENSKQATLVSEISEKDIVALADHGKDGKLKNMLKKTYLGHWMSRTDYGGADAHLDFARLKIENATLKESIESMEHLTSSVNRLRRSLSKAKDSSSLENIITEATHVKTALGSSLPVSWSAEADDSEPFEPGKVKVDSVSAAGFEMVELVILAAHILKEKIVDKAASRDKS